MSVKFKYHKSPNWFIRIEINNEEETRQEFTKKNGPGFFREMEEWIDSGNLIEPFETAEELTSREAKEFQNALANQDKECEYFLTETDKKMVSDWPYPDDQPAWAIYRAKLRSIIGCGELRALPQKPF